MRDFWQQCGYRLLDKTSDGHLLVTDDFLRSLLERPELAPVPQSCDERTGLAPAPACAAALRY